MGRHLALLLRFCVIASAVAVLIIGVRAAHAQTAPQSYYGFNAGQGGPPRIEQQSIPVTAPAPQAPYGYSPQTFTAAAPYGYNPASAPAPYSAAPAQPPQQPLAAATNYGAQQAPASPMAYYQAPDNGAARSNADYQLGPGDKIRVTVFGETDLSGEYQVDGSGVVRLPLIGTVRAVGYTAPALEAWIGTALSQGYLKNPRVNVEIITYRPFYIVGAVNRPGEYPYVDNMSAMNAVALAGGFTDTAKQSTVYVRHEGSTVEEEVPTDEITHIRPGDVVRVKTTLFWDAMSIFSPLAGPAAIAAAVIH